MCFCCRQGGSRLCDRNIINCNCTSISICNSNRICPRCQTSDTLCYCSIAPQISVRCCSTIYCQINRTRGTAKAKYIDMCFCCRQGCNRLCDRYRLIHRTAIIVFYSYSITSCSEPTECTTCLIRPTIQTVLIN